MTFRKIIFASAALMIVPAMANAQNYYGYNTDTDCQQSVNNGQTAGGLGGAIAGAAIGSNLASKGVKKEGAVLGAVLGAVVGSSIGKNRIACDDKYQYQQNQQQQYYDQSYQYNNGYQNNNGYSYNDQYQNNNYSNNGYYGNTQYYGNNNSYYSNNPGYYHGKKKGHHKNFDTMSYPNSWNMQGDCGYGQAAYRLPNGQMAYKQVYMCRKPDGGWSVVE